MKDLIKILVWYIQRRKDLDKPVEVSPGNPYYTPVFQRAWEEGLLPGKEKDNA